MRQILLVLACAAVAGCGGGRGTESAGERPAAAPETPEYPAAYAVGEE